MIGLAALVPVVFVPMAPPAKAASLVQVTNFGNNPSSLQMYIYSVTANPPILLALHGCQGSGPTCTPVPSSPRTTVRSTIRP